MYAKLMLTVCAAVVSLLFAIPGQTAIDADNFVGAWLLDEGHGDRAHDSSGRDHQGVIEGNGYEWIDGPYGRAVALSGAGDYITVEIFGQVVPTEDITVLIWARIDDAGRNQPLLSLDPFDANGRLTVLMPWDGRAQWHFGTPFQFATIPFPEAAVGEWWHWAFVSSTSAGLITLYMNGVEAEIQHVGGAPAALQRRPDPFHIGGGLGETFLGAVDEVAVYNGALEVADILAIMDDGLGRYAIGAAVEPKDKLTSAWGRIKTEE